MRNFLRTYCRGLFEDQHKPKLRSAFSLHSIFFFYIRRTNTILCKLFIQFIIPTFGELNRNSHFKISCLNGSSKEATSLLNYNTVGQFRGAFIIPCKITKYSRQKLVTNQILGTSFHPKPEIQPASPRPGLLLPQNPSVQLLDPGNKTSNSVDGQPQY